MKREEIYQRLYQAIVELPEENRKLFWLYFQGRNVAETAKILSLSEREIKTRRREIVAMLRNHLGDLFFWIQMMRFLK